MTPSSRETPTSYCPSFHPEWRSRSPNATAIPSCAPKRSPSSSSATPSPRQPPGASRRSSMACASSTPASSGDLPRQGPRIRPRVRASTPPGPKLTNCCDSPNYGLDIAVLEGRVGAASALKLAYAGMTKGFTALATAMVNAASREGLADALRTELARTQPGLPDAAGALDSRHVPESLSMGRRDGADRRRSSAPSAKARTSIPAWRGCMNGSRRS